MSDGLPVTAGAAIFRRLHRLGVDRVFVNSGTDFPPIIEGLAEGEAHGAALPLSVVVPHEHVAVSMAHGHFFATGRPAAVILHTNVGLANGAIGAINAATDHVPMILMSGRTPSTETGRFGSRTVPIGWGQEMRDQAALVREACKWDYEVRFPEQVPALLDRAHAIATSTPKGPVYLSLPREVLCEPCPADALDAPPAMAPASLAPHPDDLARAANLLTHAARPLIIAQRGAGSPDGFAALAQLAQRWSIPVCQWWAVATAISAEHPMYVGQEPGPWLAEADVVLVIDSLAPWMPDVHHLRDDCRVIQLGPNPLYSRFPVRNFRSDVSIATETGPGLVALAAVMSQPDEMEVSARRAVIDAYNTDRRAPIDRTTLTKASVAAAIGTAIRGRRATVISELGATLDELGLTEHDAWRQEPHSGGLGWGLPCALGMKLADPDRLVVATMGDGSYLFANPVAAHHVAEAHGIAVLTVILNNAGYVAVQQSVTGLYPTGYAAKADVMPLTSLSPSPEFRLVAESCRAWAETVSRPDDLAGALSRAIEQVDAGRQAVLDVHIN
ncbi:MAG: acetolactate synthase [Desertimonas sp.]|nr:acetolactate synthase [Desertimonas sp.]